MEMNSSKKYLSEMGDIKQPIQRSTKISIGMKLKKPVPSTSINMLYTNQDKTILEKTQNWTHYKEVK